MIEALLKEPGIPAGWLILIAILTGLGGGGGVAAILKVHSDRKEGIESHEVVEGDAIASRWQQLTDAQLNNLLRPMEERLTRLESEVNRLSQKVEEWQKKYWRAIRYARSLLDWITRHMPETRDRPEVPHDLMEDIA